MLEYTCRYFSEYYRKGGIGVVNFFNFILSVIAGIYSYYICKWLDGDK